MAIEKGRKPNTWLITFNLPEKDASGKYKRAPKRTIHGLKSDAKKELARYWVEKYSRKLFEQVPRPT